MAGRSSQADNRGTDLFGLFVSGKLKEYHTYRSGKTEATCSDWSNSINWWCNQ